MLKKILFVLDIILVALTIAGAVYVMKSGGKVSPGYAVIPMVMALATMGIVLNQNRKAFAGKYIDAFLP